MRFVYKARDWNGKMIKGEGDFYDQKEVIESLRSSGLVPIFVAEERQNFLAEFYKNTFSRVGLKQISMLTRQLSTMMNSGLPLTDALALLKNQMDRGSLMYEILDHALKTVQKGNSLAEGLKKYKNIFGEAYIASVEAGEEAGVLDEIMTKLAENLEKQNEFQSKVKGAMIYPIIVVVGMIAVVIIMMVFVIPKLLTMYADFGAEMPTSTKILMKMSTFMGKFWFLMPVLVVLVWGVFWMGKKDRSFGYKIDTFKLKFVVIGDLIKKNVLATTIRTLSMLLSAGISLVEALKIIAGVAGNIVYMEAFLRIAERVQKGFSIANSFEETGVFPLIVNQMLATGEATGKLDEVLLKVSDYFASEAEQSVRSLTSAIEPLIMIVLGLGVAFLVVAVVMPIYNLTSQF